ncbi:MAG: HAMP domain-containing histidine kinase [Deltaproteobacteria bacterium]|nr:HAMP domain-containing histidine kinase [Deltaproteobacteria bacterium]
MSLPVYVFPPMLAAAVILALAVVSLTHRRPDALSVAFAVFCVSWSGVASLNFALQLTGSVALARLVPGSVWLTYAAMAGYITVLGDYHQALRTPVYGVRPDVWLGVTWVMALGFGLAAARSDFLVSGMLHSERLGYAPVFAVRGLAFQLPMGVAGGFGYVLLIRAWRRAEAPATKAFLRHHMRALIGLGAFAAVLGVLLPHFGLPTFALLFDGFALVAFYFFGILVRYHHQRVEDLNATLEQKVLDRTRELEEAQARLVQAEKIAALGRFVAGVAHEMNTPLGAVKSAKDTSMRAARGLLAQARGEAEPRRVAALEKALGDSEQVLEQGLERIDGIVHRLRSFVRLDESEVLTIDLAASLDAALGLMGPELAGRVVERRFEAQRKVTCKAREVNQALLNVLTNAAQAAGPGGHVTVRTVDVGGAVVVEVEDDGPGIPPENLPRIFDPGFTTRGVGVGTGMGLAVVYRVVQDHHGKVDVQSTVGEGTAVRIELPATSPEASRLAEAGADPR